MAAQPLPRVTLEDYLNSERASESRSEYYRGEVFPMEGASRAHGTILLQLAKELLTALHGRRCELMTGVLLRTSKDGLYTYPDLMAVCGEEPAVDNQQDVVLNPVLIVEVLSPSTEGHDRGFKFGQYRKLQSLQEYVLVWQTEPHMEKFVRQASGEWLMSEVVGLDATCSFTSVGCQVPLSGVHAGVPFPEASSA